MTRRNAFVTEVTVDFEHAIEATDNQTLQVQFRRDTQVHIDIERIVVSDERTRRRTARDHLHHRGFDFHEAVFHHKAADTRHDLRTDFEGLTGIFVSDQVEITLTVTRFLILQAVEFVRQRTQCFGQQTQFRTMDRQFAGLGFEQFTGRTQDIAQIPFLELLVVDAFCEVITRNVKLDTATDILQGHERCLAHNTAGHHTATHGDFDV
ncbi:hypothetical protein SRABI106_02135 [Rahnella aquatilis]|nr:hypothetical protein SRABI106_02135 [Rahnella aquatilis]